MAQRLSEVKIKDYLNSSFDTFFILKEVSVRPQKGDKECMNLVLKDKSTEVEAKIFDITSTHKDLLKPGRVYYAVIDVKEYAKGKDGISCIINEMPQEMTEMQPELFADWIDNYDVYNAKLGELLTYVNDSDYGKIAYDVIQSNWEKFSVWGAAKSLHHTALGGLLMHSVCVAELSKSIGEFYNKIYGDRFVNLKLLVSACLLHDVMKTKELTCDVKAGSMDYDTSSSLTTHVVEIAIAVEKSALKLGIENQIKIEELKHCLLAHHGQLEWGSPIVPCCMEAQILHTVDEIDAYGWRYGVNTKDLAEHDRMTLWAGKTPLPVYKTSIENDGVDI